MPVSHTSNPKYISVGAGIAYWAPLATVEPTWTVTGSVFTNAIAAPWVEIGATEDGVSFNQQRTVSELVPEESFLPEKVVTTGLSASVVFNMWYINDDNWILASNGGAWVTTGSGTTAVNVYSPPTIGSETRCTLLWVAADSTHAFYFPQCFNTANVSVALKKAPNKATLPVEFALEMPTSGIFYHRITAGQSYMQP